MGFVKQQSGTTNNGQSYRDIEGVMKVFVTGATGFIGSNLVQYLLNSGQTVNILARSESKARPFLELGANLIQGEITDYQALQAGLGGVEVVYHLAGKLFAPDVPLKEYYRIHKEGTRVLLDCCQRQSRIKRFIHISTTGVLGASDELPRDENASCNPTNAYEDSKWKAELQVREAIQQGFPAVIIRPGLVYGPGDLHLLGFFRMIKYGLFRPIGKKPVWLHPIYIDDLNQAIFYCSHSSQAIGECFHIAGQAPVTIAQLASTIAAAFGKRLPNGYIPLPLATALAVIGDMLPNNIKSFAPLTRSRLEFLIHSRVYNVTKAMRILNFCGETELSKGITQTVAWYQEHRFI